MNSIWMRQDIENRPFRRLTLLRTVANEMSRGLFGACGQRDPSGAVPGTGRELQRKNQEGGGITNQPNPGSLAWLQMPTDQGRSGSFRQWDGMGSSLTPCSAYCT